MHRRTSGGRACAALAHPAPVLAMQQCASMVRLMAPRAGAWLAATDAGSAAACRRSCLTARAQPVALWRSGRGQFVGLQALQHRNGMQELLRQRLSKRHSSPHASLMLMPSLTTPKGAIYQTKLHDPADAKQRERVLFHGHTSCPSASKSNPCSLSSSRCALNNAACASALSHTRCLWLRTSPSSSSSSADQRPERARVSMP